MSKNFVGRGRGRGWLNAQKNKNKSAPGILPNLKIPVDGPPKSIKCINEEIIFADVPEYEFLFKIVKKLNIADDGVKFLQDKWNEGCTTSEEVEQSIQALYQASLQDGELASRLVCLMSSDICIPLEVRGKNIRSMFLSQLRNNDNAYKNNPVAFRNFTRMLGEFFNKGRMGNGDPYSLLAVPLAGNLQTLLDSAHPEDLQLLATQLFTNGFGLRAECPEKFAKLLNNARMSLVSRELSKESKLWLLLCIDGANNKFGLFSADLYKFYDEQLGEAATRIIQGTPSILRIQTNQRNKFLDTYQSDINVLKVCSVIDSYAPKSNSHFNTSNTSQGSTSGFVSDSSSTSGGTTFQRSRNPSKPNLDVGYKPSGLTIDTGLKSISSTRKERGSGQELKPKGGWEGQGNAPVVYVTSTDVWSRSTRRECGSGQDDKPKGGSGQDDKPQLGWKVPPRNSRLPRKPLLSVEAMLSKCNIRTGSSSASDKEYSKAAVKS